MIFLKSRHKKDSQSEKFSIFAHYYTKLEYRMNKITISIVAALGLLSLTNSSADAQTRSMDNVRQIAREKLLCDDAVLATANKAFSIYNSKNDKGFVIVSTDEKLPAILGYSDTGVFDPDNIPPAMKFWMSYTEQACNAVIDGTAPTFEPYVATRANKDITPLLGDINWGQDDPYNLKTPTYSGGNYVTGCVATALSMILKYYQYPEQGVGQINYTSKSNSINVSYDFGNARFDYAKMLDTYSFPDFGKPTGEKVNKSLSPDLVCVSLVPSGSYKGVLVYVDTLLCKKSDSFTGSVRFALYSNDDEFIDVVGGEVILKDLPSNAYYKAYPLSATMPSRIEDGTYKLYLASKAEGSDEWALVKRYNPQTRMILSPKPVEIIKKGDKVFIGNYSGSVQYDEESALAVAELMAACGAAVEMDYTTGGSGAYSDLVHIRAYEYFKYDYDGFMAWSDNMNTKDMNRLIVEQLENGHPVYIGGTDKDSKEGHAFIADGVRYNAYGTPLFHINWGWDGMSNGYFLITNFSPGMAGTGASDNENFSDKLRLVCGVKPEDGKDEGPAITYASTECSKEDVNVGDQITITVNNFTNASAYTINGEMWAFLADDEGNEWNIGRIDVIDDIQPFVFKTYTYTRKNSVTIPASVPSGTYQLIARICQNTNPNVFGRALSSYNATINVSNPTGITQITDDGNEAEDNDEAYDLNGRKVNAAQEGIVVRKNKITLNN